MKSSSLKRVSKVNVDDAVTGKTKEVRSKALIIHGAAARTKGNNMDHPKEQYYWIYPKP